MCRCPDCGSKPGFEGRDIEAGVDTLRELMMDVLRMSNPITINKEGALESLLTDKYKLPESIANVLGDFFRLIAPGNKEKPLYLYVQGGDPEGNPAFTKILASKAKFDGDCPNISQCPTLAVLIERGSDNRINHMAFLISQKKSQGPGEPLAQYAMAFGFRRKPDGTVEEYDVPLEDLKRLGYKPLTIEGVFPRKKHYIDDVLRERLLDRLSQDL